MGLLKRDKIRLLGFTHYTTVGRPLKPAPRSRGASAATATRLSSSWQLAAMEMRQRSRPQEPASSSEPVSAIAETIKRLDVYPKTLDDFKERTGSGAVVSLVSLSVIALLVISELSAYLTPTTVDHLYVDTSRGERIKVNLNITFPNMPCAGMSLVAMDVAGEQQIDVVSNIIKTRRTLAGAKIGIEMDEEHVRRKFAGQCGACFPQVELGWAALALP